MEILTIKIFGGIILWICMVIFGLLPIYSKHFRSNSRFLFVCNCFCGGLFLSIGLIHILPQAYNMLDGMPMMQQNLQSENFNLKGCTDIGIKWSFLICMCSFSAILLLDKVIFNNSDLAEKTIDDSQENKILLRHSFQSSSSKQFNYDNIENMENNFKEIVSSKFKIALRLSRNSNFQNKSESLSKNSDTDEKNSTKIKINKTLSIPKYKKIINLQKSEDLNEHLIENEKCVLKNSSQEKTKKYLLNSQSLRKNIDFTTQENLKQKKNLHEGHQHQNLISKEDSFLTSIILLAAMGIHGFFSLLAFGIEPTKKGTINLFIALVVHKWSEALTVGII